MASPYPTLRVKADSQNFLATDGRNDITGGETVTDKDGIALTNANASCFVTVTASDSSVSFARAAMAYVSAGLWTYTLPATAFAGGHGPWTVKVQVFDQTGTSGTLLRTFYATAKETD